MKLDQPLVNHIAIGIDASTSMDHLTQEVIKVVDGLIAHLAKSSKDRKQVTRVSVYTFASEVQCVISEMDVVWLPSIAEFYRPYGWTALVDATVLAMDDLAMTPQKYGDHAFLLYMVTDGGENNSKRENKDRLPRLLDDRALPSNWTVAALVPDEDGKRQIQRYGFPENNVAVWDATSAAGVEEAGQRIREATDRFMEGRAKGLRRSRSVFSTGTDAVNSETIQQAGLTPLPHSNYKIVPVPYETQIRPFVQECGYPYKVGIAFYQLTKREEIQATKEIAVMEKSTQRVFTGPEVRDLIGLPQITVRVKPDFNPLYEIYVQSTSINRKLLPGTKLLIIP